MSVHDIKVGIEPCLALENEILIIYFSCVPHRLLT